MDGIATNFRVKKVYASDNQLESIEGIKKYKFLDTLLLGNNQLRNLDKFLAFLSSKFAFLEQLDLYGNPLAEEPDYRLKIIHEMPQIKLLDRHKVTVEERLKAEKLWEREHGATAGSTKKHMSQILTHAGKSTFSKGEKDLYKEVGELRKLDQERLRQEELDR